MINSPGFVGTKVIDESLVIVYQTAPAVTLDKPIHLAAAILDHSKRIMTNKFYEVGCVSKY